MDASKAPRDERIEALVKARDSAIQKQKVAEAERDRLKQQADAAASLQAQVETLKGTIASLERQQFESRQFEQVLLPPLFLFVHSTSNPRHLN